jgi:hypothetical protein
MINEPVNRWGEDTRKRPQEGRMLNRAPQSGYMPPGEMDCRQSAAQPGTNIAGKAAKGALKKALPYLIAGGSTGLAAGGLLGYILFS